MSSRVFPPDDLRAVSGPVLWRRVDLPLAARATNGAASAPAQDSAATTKQQQIEHELAVREAHAAGVREGETAGRNRAAAEFQPVVERLSRSIQEIANLRSRLRREAEADVVQLAIAIARRVVRREVATDPDALHGLVVAALEKLQGQEVSRVKVHPSHVAMMKSCLHQAVNGGQVDVLGDASNEPGSVIFETTRGNLDASVDSQLNEIERGLTDRLRRQS